LIFLIAVTMDSRQLLLSREEPFGGGKSYRAFLLLLSNVGEEGENEEDGLEAVDEVDEE